MARKPQDRSQDQSAKDTALRAGVQGELWGLLPGTLPAKVSTEALSRGSPQAAISRAWDSWHVSLRPP